jgi:hypothetical protein
MNGANLRHLIRSDRKRRAPRRRQEQRISSILKFGGLFPRAQPGIMTVMPSNRLAPPIRPTTWRGHCAQPIGLRMISQTLRDRFFRSEISSLTDFANLAHCGPNEEFYGGIGGCRSV